MPNQDGSITDNDVVILDPLDTEGNKKSFETLAAQKNHWRSKAVDPTSGKTYKELYELASKPKETPLSPDPKPDAPKPAPDQDSMLDNLEVIRDLASDELSELRVEAKNLGVDPIKYVKSKAGQAHLKEFRTTKKTQDSISTPSARIPVFNGKPVDDILRDEKSSPADKQKAFDAKLRASRGSNSSV